MLWIKVFHIIFMVLWFSGLFYLPRIFVYHANSSDTQMNERFLLMEKKLYYGVLHPGAALTLLLGFSLLYLNWDLYIQAPWLHLKLALVFCLLGFQFYLGHLLKNFARHRNTKSAVFYRWLNELPTLALLGIIFLVVLKPRFF
jgi:putative membrane protein